MFALVDGSFFVSLLRLPMFCRLRACLRHSWKPRPIRDKIMLLVGIVHGWVRWIWEGNFLRFHWPAGQVLDCCSLSAVEVPGEPFLGEVLMHPHMHGSCCASGNQCSQADFISCPFYSQPLFPHTAPYTFLLPKGHQHPALPLTHFFLSSEGTFHMIPVCLPSP